jgi:hypothetical protein
MQEVQPYLEAEGGTLIGFLRRSFGDGRSVATRRAINDLIEYVTNLHTGSPSVAELSSEIRADAERTGTDWLARALSVLVEAPDPEPAIRVVAQLLTVFPDASIIGDSVRALAARLTTPQTRAQLLLYAAGYASGPLKRWLQEGAIASAAAVDEPQMRFFILLNAAPDLPTDLREVVTRELLENSFGIREPTLRGRVLVGVLPYLDANRAVAIAAAALTLVPELQYPEQKLGILKAAARTFAASGDISRAFELAELAGSPVASAHVLLETAPWVDDAQHASVLLRAVRALAPASLEHLLAALSPASGARLAGLASALVMTSARRAANAGRFLPAMKIAALLEEEPRNGVASEIIDIIQRTPSLESRVVAVTEIAAWVPVSLLDTAVRIAADVGSSPRFWMPDSVRADAVEYLKGRKGPAFLGTVLIDAGQAIAGTCHRGRSISFLPFRESLDLSPATVRWADIASRCGNIADAGAFVAAAVRAAVESGDTTEALEILNVASPVAKVVGAGLEPVVEVAKHRIQLAFRQTADERHLERYLPRQDQIDDFNKLKDEPDGPSSHWALHYLGMGGVGKTMLLRHVAARLAVDKSGNKLPTARVDFDLISPDFPLRKPGELLATLAEELRFYGGPDQDARYTEFTNLLLSLHGTLSKESPSNDPLYNIRTDAFRQLLDKFRALLAGLPSPVILILDTCEELAKLEPAGDILPSVEATFKILEDLHHSLPQIRVVFAGRRLLARAGDRQPDGEYRWAARPGTLSERNKLLPESKEYLRLHVVRGFTEQDATDFFKLLQIQVDSNRHAAILKSSPDTGAPADIRWHDDPHPLIDEERRYNPFDLRLYADWIHEDPNVTAEIISSGATDPYVELRILKHMPDDLVRGVLPAVVLLRRFDIEKLRDVVNGGGEALQRVYHDLGAQEWIDYQQDILQVDRNLLGRLQKYYEHEDRRYLQERARNSLRPVLAKLMNTALSAQDPFSTLTVANVDAALRLLPIDEAAAVWEQIDRRVTDGANWSWAENVCSFLLVENNAAGPAVTSDPVRSVPREQRLRAAVRATMTAAVSHTSARFRPEWWKEVEILAPLHPNPTIRKSLENRAKIAQGPLTQAHVQLVEEFRGDAWRFEQLAAALAASLERLSDVGATSLPRLDSKFALGLSVEVRAFLMSVYARISEDSNLIANVKALAASAPPPPTLQRWADWHAPACIADRVRLELLRRWRRASKEELNEWSSAAVKRANNADSERLLSRLIQLALESDLNRVPALTDRSPYDPKLHPDCIAHRETPPLFASIAEADLARNGTRDPSRLLNDVLPMAQAAADREAVDAATMVSLKIMRQMRQPTALSATVELIARQQPLSTPFHRWWATQIAITPNDTAKLVDAVEKQFFTLFHADGSAGLAEFHRSDGSLDGYSALDAFEVGLLATRLGQKSKISPFYERSIEQLTHSLDLHVRLRALALNRARIAFDEIEPLLRPRMVAEIALEEAELLALRLPDYTFELYGTATNLFGQANDAFGLMRAFMGTVFAAISARYKPQSDVLGHLQEIYERCRSISDLPEWSEIQPDQLRRFASHRWYDWLLRIARLKVWLLEHDDGPVIDTVKEAIVARYGTVPQFELSAVPPTRAAVAAPLDPKKTSPAFSLGVKLNHSPKIIVQRERKWPNIVVDIIGIIITVAVVTGVAVAVAGGARWSLRHLAYIEFVAGSLGVAGVIWLLSRVARRMLARVIFQARRPRVLIQRTTQEQAIVRFTSDPPHGIFRYTSRFYMALDSFDLASFPRPGYGSYAEFASSFPPQRFLWRISRALPGTRFPMALICDHVLAQYPWEAPLNIAARGNDCFEFVRSSDLVPPPTGLADWASAGVYVVCRSTFGEMLDRAWQKIERGASSRVEMNLSGTFVPPGRRSLRVTHLVGASVGTASGPVFTITPRRSNQFSPVKVEGFAGGPAIVIVQEEPVERILRLDTDREQTAQTREWAADLFRSGVHTVILVPALPLELARKVVETIAKGLRDDKPPDLFELLRVVTRCRNIIKSAKQESRWQESRSLSDAEIRAALRELSLEVTFFSRSIHLQAANQFTGFTHT